MVEGEDAGVPPRGEEDGQRKSTVQQILQKSTDFLGLIIAPVGGLPSVSAMHAKNSANRCEACGGQHTRSAAGCE